jgi:hypothetical protein
VAFPCVALMPEEELHVKPMIVFLGLCALIAFGTSSAIAASSAASTFNLVFKGEHEDVSTSDAYPLGFGT